MVGGSLLRGFALSIFSITILSPGPRPNTYVCYRCNIPRTAFTENLCFFQILVVFCWISCLVHHRPAQSKSLVIYLRFETHERKELPKFDTTVDLYRVEYCIF